MCRILTSVLVFACGLTDLSAAAEPKTGPGLPERRTHLDRSKAEQAWEAEAADKAGASRVEGRDELDRARPIIEAIIAVAAHLAGDPEAVRQRIPGVRWDAGLRSASDAGFIGMLDDFTVEVVRTGALRFSWSAVGAPPPFDPAEALRSYGATTERVGCSAVGPSETTTVYRVSLADFSPLGLQVYFREAPTANAHSFLSIMAFRGAELVSLDDLRQDEPDANWSLSCS